MTKLVQWLIVAGTMFVVWLGLLTNTIPINASPSFQEILYPVNHSLATCKPIVMSLFLATTVLSHLFWSKFHPYKHLYNWIKRMNLFRVTHCLSLDIV